MLKSVNPKPSMPSLPPTEGLDIIYPLIQTVVKVAGLSYITEKSRSTLNPRSPKLPELVVVEGFSEAISEFNYCIKKSREDESYSTVTTTSSK